MSVDNYLQSIEELRDQALQLDDGPTKVSLLEECVRLADTHQDLEKGDQLREDLIRAASFGGHPEVSLVAFSWRLAQADRHPDKFDESELLWSYKWIVASLTEFPHVERAQIEGALADMETRYRRNGSTLYALHHLRRRIAMFMGDKEEACRAHESLQLAQRDWLADCKACVLDEDVQFYAYFDRHEDALRCSAPIVTGRCKCEEVPHRTFARLLLPFLHRGVPEGAAECHRSGYPLIAQNPEFIECAAEHLLYLALINDRSRALQLVSRHLPVSLASPSPWGRLEVLYSTRFLFSQLLKQGVESVKVSLPPSFPLHNESGDYNVREFYDWCVRDSDELIALFDARNGNTHYRDRLEKILRLPETIPDLGRASS